ncbi:MAG: hypothetical protein K0Q63_3040 [Paenibacillus sp.]|jgi:NitT/TauT family transport system substrate-binding protein|nr:hypothetical protein [Paenibacillus sp.]
MTRQRLNLLNVHEATELLGISRATFDRWRKHKNLPYTKIGKEILVDKSALEKWIQIQGHAGEPQDSAASERIVTIGYQSGAALLWSSLIMKKLGWFEEELRKVSPSRSYQVRWVNAPSGIELVEELIAGRVQIASVGDFPMAAAHALSGILPGFKPLLLAFDGKAGDGNGISLVVPSGRGASHETIAPETVVPTVGQSSASYRLQEWMKESKLSFQPLPKRGMGDCMNSLLEGTAGAAMLWEPYLSWAQSLGACAPLAGGGIGADYLTGLMADSRWANAHEDVVIAYLKAHLRTHRYIRSHPAEAAAHVQDGSGFPASLVHRVLGGIRWDASVYSRDLLTLKQLGADHSGWPSIGAGTGASVPFCHYYLHEAAQALRLPLLPDVPLPGRWGDDWTY